MGYQRARTISAQHVAVIGGSQAATSPANDMPCSGSEINTHVSTISPFLEDEGTMPFRHR